MSLWGVINPLAACPADLNCGALVIARGKHIYSLNIFLKKINKKIIYLFFIVAFLKAYLSSSGSLGSMRPLLVSLFQAEFPDSMPIFPYSVYSGYFFF